MATLKKNRARFGYLNYNAMLEKIADGKLDAYDVNFAPDTKECYVITPELTPWAIKTKVYTFDNEASAVEALNVNTDTYTGQFVSILSGETYKAYIVNKNDIGFYVTPLQDSSDIIDYDSLGNRPIINLYGTLDKPIIVDTLDSGAYMIKGQYTISGIETVFLSATNVVFLVEKSDNTVYLKRITSAEITDYTIIDGTTIQTSIVTTKYLEEQGYTTTTYVDEKIAALDFITKDEAKAYIEEMISSSSAVEELIDAKIDTKIDTMLEERETENESIDSLF